MEYARIKTSTGELQEIRDFATSPIPLSIPHKDLDWRPVTRILPVIDSATQLREGPFTTINANGVTIEYTVRSKTPAEIDADRDILVGHALDHRGMFKVFGQALLTLTNEVRVLKGQPTITAAQFRTYLKSLL